MPHGESAKHVSFGGTKPGRRIDGVLMTAGALTIITVVDSVPQAFRPAEVIELGNRCAMAHLCSRLLYLAYGFCKS